MLHLELLLLFNCKTSYLFAMLSVRELKQSDIPLLLNYWFNADEDFVKGMGVDVKKMPTREQFQQMLTDQLNTPVEQRRSYCIVWLDNGVPVGHSNTNPTTFGEEAKMHLHLWEPAKRTKGMGTQLLKLTLPHFFNNLQLKTLWCEPYALNPAPNRTLEKVGFEFVKEYITVPGFINFEQPVKQWKITAEQFKDLEY